MLAGGANGQQHVEECSSKEGSRSMIDGKSKGQAGAGGSDYCCSRCRRQSGIRVKIRPKKGRKGCARHFYCRTSTLVQWMNPDPLLGPSILSAGQGNGCYQLVKLLLHQDHRRQWSECPHNGRET